MKFSAFIPILFIFCSLLTKCTFKSTWIHSLTTWRYPNGTKTATVKKFPFIAVLRSRITKNQFCSGAIVTQYHVLTSARCVRDEGVKEADMLVYVGGSGKIGDSYVHIINNITIHPNYTGQLSNLEALIFNIAVIELYKPVEFDETRKKIQISKSGITSIDQATAVGWGMYVHGDKSGHPKPLRSLMLTVQSSSKCSKRFYHMVHPGQVCSHIPNSANISYPGDRGGPLVRNHKLVAVFSYASQTKEDNLLIFTSIPQSFPFISRMTGIKLI